MTKIMGSDGLAAPGITLGPHLPNVNNRSAATLDAAEHQDHDASDRESTDASGYPSNFHLHVP